MTISVIIPIYNAALFVERAIKSCLLQEEVIEIICIDDGSHDNSLSILKKWHDEDNRISIFQHPNNENRGPALSRNLGLKHASGDFISFLDADDYYLENRFISSLKRLKSESNLEAVYCTALNEGKITNQYPKLVSEPSEGTNLLAQVLSGSLSIALWTVLYRKDAITKLPKFNSDLIVGQDLQYVFHSLNKLKVAHCGDPKPLMHRTLHESNRTKKHAETIHINCRRKIFTYWYQQLKKESFTSEEKHHITKHYSSYVLQEALPRLYHTPLIGRLLLRLFYVYNRLA